MPQNVLDDAVTAIKRNWKEFTDRFGDKSPPPPKDYFAHGWKPPAGNRTGSHFTPYTLGSKPKAKRKVGTERKQGESKR